MQAEQGTVGITSSIEAIRHVDVITTVEHTTSNGSSANTNAATSNSSPIGTVRLVNSPMPETRHSITNNSSSDQGTAETAITVVCVDTSAASNTSSCSNTSEGTVAETATTSTAAPSTTSSIVINSSSSTVLSQVKLAVHTKEQTVSSITNTVKVSLLHCDDQFTPVRHFSM
jgi:hypothetical protein